VEALWKGDLSKEEQGPATRPTSGYPRASKAACISFTISVTVAEGSAASRMGRPMTR